MKLRHRAAMVIAAALVVLVGGIVAAFLTASSMSMNNSRLSEQQFKSSAQEISSNLRRTLQHEEDLTVSAVDFVLENPNATEADLLSWESRSNVFGRYPEIFHIGEIHYVPASQLSAFETQLAQDQASARGMGAPSNIVPLGTRSYYCLEAVGDFRSTSKIRLPAGEDYCDSAGGSYLLASRELGIAGFIPITIGKKTYLVVSSPVYQGGSVPSTDIARVASFIGWTDAIVDPKVVLDSALRNHPQTLIRFRYDGFSPASFSYGSAPAGSQSMTVLLGSGWSAQLLAPVTQGAVIDDRSAAGVFVAGLLASIILSALILAFGIGRSVALKLVKQRTDEIQHQALHDALTGLPNRALILDRLEQMLARSRRDGAMVGVLYIDIDNFKDVNDTQGHNAGDELLVAFGARLETALREGDTIGRMGGDEFVVLVEDAPLSSGIELAAERFIDLVEIPFTVSTSKVPLSVTISIGVATGTSTTTVELLRNAAIALHEAKAAGKRQFVVFSHSMQQAIQERHDLEVDLLAAVGSDQFFLLYQPIVELSSGRMIGVEALLRWNRPGSPVVNPDNFVPVLEASGLIVPVGNQILSMACDQGAAWQRQGHVFSISVNISAKHFESDLIFADVEHSLSWSGLTSSSLTLEVTETTVMSDAAATSIRLRQLKELGVRVAIDDFGTGYSSLSYLRDLPVDILKIDKSFVSSVSDNSQSAAIVRTLVQLGNVLGLETVAEGIENADQLSLLVGNNVYGGQGFFFARPMTADGVIEFFKRSSVDAPSKKSED